MGGAEAGLAIPPQCGDRVRMSLTFRMKHLEVSVPRRRRFLAASRLPGFGGGNKRTSKQQGGSLTRYTRKLERQTTGEMPQPAHPKIYHIVHVDRLGSIATGGHLLSDAVMSRRLGTGTTIGMSKIKERRLTLPLTSHPGLNVGECVPFYWCPRSVMLFLIKCDNDPDLTYHGGQQPIVHLEADFQKTVQWAEANEKR